MRAIRVACFCLVLCFLVTPRDTYAFAGDPQPVTIDVTVDSHDGDPIAGLTKDDFTILDNGKPQDITSFRSDKDNTGQTTMILVFDAADTTRERLAFAKQQIIDYLKADNGHLAYPTALAVVTRQSVKMQGVYTSDGNLLAQDLAQFDVDQQATQNVAGSRGTTSQMPMRALQGLLALPNATQGRRLMIWISPGWVVTPGPSAQGDAEKIFAQIVQFSDAMRSSHTTLCAIDPQGNLTPEAAGPFYVNYRSYLKPVKKPGDASFGNLSLQVIAVNSGGVALGSSSDVAGLIGKVIRSSESFYTLSFMPPAAKPNEFHAIEIKMNKPGLKANARPGYYTSQ
ncbi:VWA domain-containing protein [Silvibacterium acidisoli]|uniref:VWA domain-containing protein n=1 Tax=Acidobacteriaceae bacterium ZG23-2 TaxID=2883246 RepID=UPI00406C6641